VKKEKKQDKELFILLKVIKLTKDPDFKKSCGKYFSYWQSEMFTDGVAWNASDGDNNMGTNTDDDSLFLTASSILTAVYQ
jgi:hypothetical protein